MGMKLSHRLIDLGFFSALGTSEHPGFTAKECHVTCGSPFKWDYNNGVTVIYDEAGRPWIYYLNREPGPGIPSFEEFTAIERELVREYDLQRGATVPHSNDSGHFVRTVMSQLLPASQ